jgi:adenylylsulfate kinase-like enzyme
MSPNWPDSATFWRNKRVVVTGVSSPYEEPEAAELVIESDLRSAEDAVEAKKMTRKDKLFQLGKE